ncbi:hypothetical protein NQK81_13715 [Amycolatopsis roodepoortensis]|nr:hypothetical protein [Amycolatopsis roodepoortensis]UUV34457.1 hypothetical protein NQK81_13715 [Amycolatopsis roodepoortensis]
MTDDFDPCGAAEAVPAAVVPEPRHAPENDFPAEHIVLGYN